MWRAYQRASHLLQERQAVEAALREGEILVERGEEVHYYDEWQMAVGTETLIKPF